MTSDIMNTDQQQSNKRKLQPVLSSDKLDEYIAIYQNTGKIHENFYRAIDIQVIEVDEDIPRNIPLVVEIQYFKSGESTTFRLVSEQFKDRIKPDSDFYKQVMEGRGIELGKDEMQKFYQSYLAFEEEPKEKQSNKLKWEDPQRIVDGKDCGFRR